MTTHCIHFLSCIVLTKKAVEQPEANIQRTYDGYCYVVVDIYVRTELDRRSSISGEVGTRCGHGRARGRHQEARLSAIRTHLFADPFEPTFLVLKQRKIIKN